MRHWQIENWTTNPIATQYQVWQQLIANGQYTAFGLQHNFANLSTISQYQQHVPLQFYEQLYPTIHAMLQGTDNMLWNTPIEWFAKSSGTTNAQSKYIPVSYEGLTENHFMASKDVLSIYYNQNPESDLLTGKGLVIGGSHEVSSNNAGIQYGDVSAVIMQNSPFWAHWLRIPNLDIALMSEWEEKLDKMAEACMHENVTSLAGVPTWTIVLLTKILKKTGKATITEVWPNLELYLHGGVNFVPYATQFKTLIGKPINYVEIYNASEGFFAAKHNAKDEGMLLYTDHGIFYEFIIPSELHLPNPTALTLSQVQLHTNYAMVISTNSGLWRYVIGDTVLFTSILPYCIKITGRTKHYINAFGEELMVDTADTAIAAACAATGATITDYTAAPIYFSNQSNGGHEWLIEFSKVPTNMQTFITVLDDTLKQHNSDYQAKRYKNIAVAPPLIRTMLPNTFATWLQSKGKLGGQHKIPRLSNDRLIVEEVLRGNLKL